VIALFFKQPYYGERGGKVGKAMLATGSAIFMGGLEQGLQDARRAVDILAALPEVDASHIGITGISMGAIQSATVCGMEPRIHKAFLTLGGFLSGLSAQAGGEPLPGTAHMVGVVADVEADGKTFHADFESVRGGQGRFKLTGIFPEIGRAGLGQGDYPWLIGAGKKTFCGTVEPVAGRTAATLINPQRLMKYRVAVGAFAGAGLSPEALKQYYTLQDAPGTNGGHRVTVTVDYKKVKGPLVLDFARDATPLAAEWAFGGTRGRARFTHWRLNAVADDSLFEAPSGLPRQDVREEDVQRMFAAAFEYAVEAAE